MWEIRSVVFRRLKRRLYVQDWIFGLFVVVETKFFASQTHCMWFYVLLRNLRVFLSLLVCDGGRGCSVEGVACRNRKCRGEDKGQSPAYSCPHLLNSWRIGGSASVLQVRKLSKGIYPHFAKDTNKLWFVRVVRSSSEERVMQYHSYLKSKQRKAW